MSVPIRHLTILQRPVFLVNSRQGLFTAAPFGSTSLVKSGFTYSGRPFSRSYGAILPSSLATNHSSALGCSPRLPVSVYGTGCIYLKLRGFSRKSAWGHYHLAPKGSVYYRASAQWRIYQPHQHLYASTYNSVCTQTLRIFVTPSQYIQVLEY